MEGVARADHLLWDWQQTGAVIARSDVVRFWMNGHDHRGGRTRIRSTDYITLLGLVENTPGQCAAVVDAFADGATYRGAAQGPARP